ncbi:MAG: agmatinase [Dethiobacter sp.]|jgi:agmatinase|nr:agmatinase [Dethiobacter sp.]
MFNLGGLCERGGGYMAAGDDYLSATLVILGAPMDFTGSFRPGSRSGPQAIRLASPGLEEYSIYSNKDLRELSFFDAGDLLLPLGNVGRSLEVIEKTVSGILCDNKFPLLLGGEHLVSLAALRAVAAKKPGLAVVHFDAHADLRSGYMGEAHSHAAVMYHAYNDLGIDLYQFGIRSASPQEVEFANQHTHFYPFHVLGPLRDCLAELRGRPLYVSIDIDVVDPAFAPGTGTPEPGGITSAELLAAVPLLAELDVVAFDLVEVAPAYDPAGITAMLAAKVIREVVMAFAK